VAVEVSSALQRLLSVLDCVVINAGVTVVIPAGAIPEGVTQEVYFKVCQDNSIMPPLDKDKGTFLYSRSN